MHTVEVKGTDQAHMLSALVAADGRGARNVRACEASVHTVEAKLPGAMGALVGRRGMLLTKAVVRADGTTEAVRRIWCPHNIPGAVWRESIIIILT